MCNSQTVSNRIKDTYQLTPIVINPGVNTSLFIPKSKSTSKYFLMVGRLVKHKKFEIVINAFKELPFKLVIIGRGRDADFFRKLAKNSSNIKFVSQVSDDSLVDYYQNCSALICPQLEDYGLSALEAQACGKPVIAYGRGGNTETIINGKTGIFFNEQTSDSLSIAIKQFSKIKINSRTIRQHALKFSDRHFMLNFKQTIDQLWQKHQITLY